MTQRPLFPDDRTQSLTRRANKLSRKAHKKRYRLPVVQPQLIADKGFTPVAGVPKTRAECPTERPCPHVCCKYHLFMEDADNRAGRPGLSSVPRDERGLTIAVPGNIGNERPGTTLRPAWLKVRGLEVEREVSVWLHMDEDGLHVYESNAGAFDYWLKGIHIGEMVRVIDNESTSPFYKQSIAHVTLTAERELMFDRYPDRMFVILRRVRETASCALDEIDKRGKHTNEQTGDCVGRHRTLVARELRKAMEKAKRAAERMGMTEGDLLRGLRELGAG